MTTKQSRHNKGSILMLALWAILMLTIFAITMASAVGSKIAFTGRVDTRHKLRYIAQAGVKNATSALLSRGENPAYDSLGELAGEGALGYGIKNINGGEAKVYGIIDEESKMNLNTAEYPVLSALFGIAAGLEKKKSDDLAAAVIDWRDTDDFPLLNGAESRHYASLRKPYNSKNNGFEVLSELMLIRGMDQAIYEDLKRYVTIYGTGRVNVNTASSVVLEALGINKTLVRKIMEFRSGLDKEIGTYDDNGFYKAEAIASDLSQAMPLTSQEVAVLSNLSSANILDIKSTVFNIQSTAVIENKKSALMVECVYDRTKSNGDNAILYWNENYFVEA